MARKYAAPASNDPKPEQKKSKLTPPQWFGRHRIQVHPGLRKKGRCFYLMRQLSRTNPMWASVKYLANQLNLTPAEVRRFRSLAVTAGWLEPTIYKGRKAFQPVKASIKESNGLWRSLVDLKMNVIVTITDLVSRREGFKIQISLEALAKKCRAADPAAVGRAITKLEGLKLLEVGRKNGVTNVYAIPVKRSVATARRRVAGLTSQEVIGQCGFADRIVETMTEIVRAAKKLQLIDIKTDGGLAGHVLDLYDAVKQERDGANMPTDQKIRIGGPLEILRRYIDWLREKDWEPSSQVLKPESKAFASFRRDFRNLEGCDPITGKERDYG